MRLQQNTHLLHKRSLKYADIAILYLFMYLCKEYIKYATHRRREDLHEPSCTPHIEGTKLTCNKQRLKRNKLRKEVLSESRKFLNKRMLLTVKTLKTSTERRMTRDIFSDCYLNVILKYENH